MPRRGYAARLAAALALALLALAGCGDDTSSAPSTEPTGPTSTATDPSSSTTTAGQAADRCPYLTAAQVSAVLGVQVTETAGTVHACFFDPPGAESGGSDDPSVMLSRINIQIDPTDYAVQSRALCQGEVTDVDVGDDAFACVAGLGPQGQLYQGRVLVSVNVDDAKDDAAGIAAAAALLREVTIPPSAG